MTTSTFSRWKVVKIGILTLVLLPLVWFLFVALAISFAASQNWSEVVADPAQLPKDVHAIRNESSSAPIAYHRLRSGFELGMSQRGVVTLQGTDIVERFIALAKLEPVDQSHPKRAEMEQALRLSRVGLSIEGDLWYASPGFGTVHQEVVDLYLLRTSKDKQTAVAYHYWTF